jgi:hypothetical protein
MPTRSLLPLTLPVLQTAPAANRPSFADPASCTPSVPLTTAELIVGALRFSLSLVAVGF